jgi:hypothetical protein
MKCLRGCSIVLTAILLIPAAHASGAPDKTTLATKWATIVIEAPQFGPAPSVTATATFIAPSKIADFSGVGICKDSNSDPKPCQYGVWLELRLFKRAASASMPSYVETNLKTNEKHIATASVSLKPQPTAGTSVTYTVGPLVIPPNADDDLVVVLYRAYNVPAANPQAWQDPAAVGTYLGSATIRRVCKGAVGKKLACDYKQY